MSPEVAKSRDQKASEKFASRRASFPGVSRVKRGYVDETSIGPRLANASVCNVREQVVDVFIEATEFRSRKI